MNILLQEISFPAAFSLFFHKYDYIMKDVSS